MGRAKIHTPPKITLDTSPTLPLSHPTRPRRYEKSHTKPQRTKLEAPAYPGQAATVTEQGTCSSTPIIWSQASTAHTETTPICSHTNSRTRWLWPRTVVHLAPPHQISCCSALVPRPCLMGLAQVHANYAAARRPLLSSRRGFRWA